jgi:hypothetical protein
LQGLRADLLLDERELDELGRQPVTRQAVTRQAVTRIPARARKGGGAGSDARERNLYSPSRPRFSPRTGETAKRNSPRYSRSPHGFEGLGSVKERAHPRDLAVPDCPDGVVVAIHLHAAGPSEIPLVGSGDNAITRR